MRNSNTHTHTTQGGSAFNNAKEDPKDGHWNLILEKLNMFDSIARQVDQIQKFIGMELVTNNSASAQQCS